MDRYPPRHPSGRPITRRIVKAEGYARLPATEPLTPRLRQPAMKDAIGFRVEHRTDRDDEGWNER